jgi:hypothetical protein
MKLPACENRVCCTVEENRYLGKSGEARAMAFLLPFVQLAAPGPDDGEDYVGWLREALPSKEVELVFQIKNARRFRVRVQQVLEWIEEIDRRPVIFLIPDCSEAGKPQHRFLVLFDWLLAHPDWVGQIKSQKTVTLPRQSFQAVGVEFLPALGREHERARRCSVSLFRVQRSRTLPISFGDIFENFGRLTSFQVPQPVLDELREIGLHSEEQAWEHFRKCWRDDLCRLPREKPSSATARWVHQTARPRSDTWIAEERSEFQRFVAAVHQCEQGTVFMMPRYARRELWPWRVFIEMFPQSLVLLETFFRRPELWQPSQAASGLLLASTLAHAADRTVSNAAHDLLRKQRSLFENPCVVNFEQYQVSAIYYAALAEAGGRRDLDRLMKFTRRHLDEADDWDLQLMPKYFEVDYWECAQFSLAKIENPTPRYLNALQHEEWRFERLRKRGYTLS